MYYKFYKSSFLIFAFTLFSSCGSLIHSSKKTFNNSLQNKPYDVIIVPGYPFDGKNWNMVLQMRVIWSNYLYQNGITKNIIFSGSAVYTPYVESKIMALYAAEMGIPKGHIFTECNAEHSVENLYYSYCLARDLGFKKIALATNSMQTNQLRGFIKKYKFKVNYLPIILDTLKKLDQTEPVINPIQAKVENFIALPKKQSFYKRLKGTFGAYIIWNENDLKKKRYKKNYKKRAEKYDLKKMNKQLP